VAFVQQAPLGAISRGQFAHWIKVAAARPTSSLPAGIPDAPSYAKCIQQVKSEQLSDQQKLSICKARYQSLRQQTLRFLISSRWIAGQSQAENISVSEVEVEKEISRQIKRSFAGPGQLESFLSERMMTRQDLAFRVRLNLLAGRLRAKANATPPKPTERQIKDFYQTNSRRFGQQASRDVQLISVKNKQLALLVKFSLERGINFDRVARRYSQDKISAASGGRVTVSAGGLVGEGLEKAVFSAPLGKIQGPVLSSYRYYIFRVLKARPAALQSLSETRPLMIDLLTAQLKRQQISAYLKNFEQQWKKRTFCASDYTIDACTSR